MPLWRDRRLVSLWEIINRVNPALFLSLGKVLEVSSFMLRPAYINNSNELITPDFRDSHTKWLAAWEMDCRELELAASLATIERLQKLLSEPTCGYREYGELAQELQGRLEDEMKDRES